MAIETRNGEAGKRCSTCHKWRPLAAFPSDSTKGSTQGGRHCRCRSAIETRLWQCHRDDARARRERVRALLNAAAGEAGMHLG